ncbi:MAG: hypothetical protein NZM25_04410 [Leptospiraceae bacterium]|nr:hypothetical protein [Leptospiraceae bacterium]MDW8305743.1 hypothetical protein [Leptospiraceae bacterium]
MLLRLLLALSFALFVLFSCKKTARDISSGAFTEIKMFLFYQEQNPALRRTVLSRLTPLLANREGLEVFRPLEGVHLLLSGRPVHLLVTLEGEWEETENLKRELDSAGFPSAFVLQAAILAQPAGYTGSGGDLPYTVLGLEKRSFSFNRLYYELKENIIDQEEKELYRDIADISVATYFCLTRSLCDSIRLLRLTQLSLAGSTILNGLYERSLQKTQDVSLFFLRKLPTTDIIRAYEFSSR